MIPNSPTWSDLTDVKGYPATDFDRPQAPALISDVSLGPLLIGDSQSKLNARYWSVYQDANDVMLTGSVNGQWDTPSALFQEAEAIKDIGLTFDQLGRAMVFYRTGTDTLKLFWYDPVLESQTIATLTTGSSLESGFDIINNTSDPDSDAMLFYTRDNVIYMRVQRDRFDTEYPESIDIGDGVTPVTGLELLSSGMRIDNRFQVVYRYQDTGYTPPIIEPPVIEPQTGEWLYKLTGYVSRIMMGRNLWYKPGDSLNVSFIIDSVDLDKPEIVLFSQCRAVHAVTPGSTQGKYGAQLLATVSGETHNVLTVIIGGYQTSMLLPAGLQAGEWSFAFDPTSASQGMLTMQVKPVGSVNTLIALSQYSIGTSQESSATFVFGGNGSDSPKNGFRGVMHSLQVETPDNVNYCPGNDKSESNGELWPIYAADKVTRLYTAQVQDYRRENWIFKPDNI